MVGVPGEVVWDVEIGESALCNSRVQSVDCSLDCISVEEELSWIFLLDVIHCFLGVFTGRFDGLFPAFLLVELESEIGNIVSVLLGILEDGNDISAALIIAVMSVGEIEISRVPNENASVEFEVDVEVSVSVGVVFSCDDIFLKVAEVL